MYAPRLFKIRLYLLHWLALAWDVGIGSSTTSTDSFSWDDYSYYSEVFPDCSGTPSFVGDGWCDDDNNNEVCILPNVIIECLDPVND